jgi:hypothetical protein
MLPAAFAVAMAGFVGAFGSGVSGIQNASAIDGDICAVDTDADYSTADGYGNDVLVVNRGETHGLVFRLEDSENDHDNTTVRIDSETGSARITSKAEWLRGDEDESEIGHILVSPPVGTQVLDTIDPDDFLDADGNELGGNEDDTATSSINAWLVDVGYTAFVSDDSDSVCGGGTTDGSSEGEDSWGFIDFSCIQPGYFHIDILAPGDTEETGHTVKFFCVGQADSATIAVSPATVEIVPVGNSKGSSVVTVTVLDQDGQRLDGAEVTFTTDKCRFDGDDETSPAGGGTTVTTVSDTDSTSDDNFLTNNPLQYSAGTAEAVLNCTGTGVTAGTAMITAIVDREGSDIVLNAEVKVVGQTSATGLTLTLTPDDIECGETILASVKAVDSLGQPVSDGTAVYFTTDTTSGVLGGTEGAQGAVYTVGGEASVLIATDPSKNGTHTVIAYTINAVGTVNAQTSDTYVCDGAVAPVAPTVAPPNNGTGTGGITPPNTGDAGLAAGNSSLSFIVIAGAVAFVLAGVASIRFARN